MFFLYDLCTCMYKTKGELVDFLVYLTSYRDIEQSKFITSHKGKFS